MSRSVLLVCPEPLGHGRPAGVGIRFIELARVLAEAGFEVTTISPDGAAPAGARGVAVSPQTILDESRRSDVAIVQGHVANDFFAHAERIPTVVDMYDPFLIENLSYAVSNEEIWAHDWNTTVASLRRGDFFLCASERQRAYYLGWLAALGRINPGTFADDPTTDSLVAIVPFGVPPARAVPERTLERPAILFGGIYDWYDPELAIEAATVAAEALPGLTLTFVSHPNATVTPQSKYAQARELVRNRGLEESIFFRDWFSYEERASIYDRHVAALLTFPRSLETELSFRTRVLDYLWGGLPVFSSPAAGTDEILKRYDAGVVLDSERAADVARRIVGVLTDPARYRTLLEGTQRFVSDYQWKDLGTPLLAFCRNPSIDRHAGQYVRLEGESLDLRPSLPERAIRKLKRMTGSK